MLRHSRLIFRGRSQSLRRVSNGLMTKAIVVGTGLTGLCAAIRLAEAGCEVVVREGRDGIGGRSLGTAGGITVVGMRVGRSRRGRRPVRHHVL
ncbi:NAD(P)-binding protein [Mycobacteroides chelonae]